MDFVDKVYDLKLLADKYGLILHEHCHSAKAEDLLRGLLLTVPTQGL